MTEKKEEYKIIKGYKVFGEKWKCRDFQYEVGKEYKIYKEPIICELGYHFCTKLIDCFNYYSFDPKNKIAEVESIGDIVDNKDEDSKIATNHIKIIKELTW